LSLQPLDAESGLGFFFRETKFVRRDIRMYQFLRWRLFKTVECAFLRPRVVVLRAWSLARGGDFGDAFGDFFAEEGSEIRGFGHGHGCLVYWEESSEDSWLYIWVRFGVVLVW
jgi:hypothetical protein